MPADPQLHSPAGPARVPTVDLNADLGEEITDDAGLLAVVTSANVACGFHAGTTATRRFVCAEAARLGVAVADSEGAPVRYFKPHGALYHRVTDDPEQAAAVLEGSGGLPVWASPGPTSCTWLRRPAARRTTRGSPTAATATGGWSTGTSPAARQAVVLAPFSPGG